MGLPTPKFRQAHGELQVLGYCNSLSASSWRVKTVAVGLALVKRAEFMSFSDAKREPQISELDT